MDRTEDQILADELAALGSPAGGSKRLMRLVSRAMRKDVHEVGVALALPAEVAHRRVAELLQREGRVLDDAPEHGPPGGSMLRAVVGGGAGGLNAAVVTVSLAPDGGPETTHLTVRAAALEGLVRQRAGERTAARLADALSA